MQCFLRPPAVFYVRAGEIKANDASLIVPEWVRAHEKPAVLSITPSQANLCFPTLSARDGIFAQAIVGVEIIVMKTLTVIYSKELILCVTVVIESSLVGMKALALAIKNNDVLGNRIDQLSQFCFRLLAIVNVGTGRIPANNVALLIAKRVEPNKKPAIQPILPQ